jgi:8-oxo-dGTP pyrophosphatase MutT (NUDIX family)
MRNAQPIPADDALPAATRDFVMRARDKLLHAPPDDLHAAAAAEHGDHQLAPELMTLLADRPVRPAAVLVPVVAREQPTLLLTVRASALPDHAGQIAFPGGKIDEGDRDPLAAALREAEEEIGLAARFTVPLGYLDPYLSGTGFRIVPAVALVTPDYQLALNRREVDDAFEVPLDFLMEPANHARHSREWQGKQRSYYAMPYGERYIWGATAGIIRRLYERLYP